MKIAVLTGSISRQSGGLFTSVRRLSQSVEQKNSTLVEVLSFADRFTENDAAKWAPLKPRTFPHIGPKGLGFSPSLKIAVLSSDADLLHLHGVWMYTARVAQEWQRHTRRPLVISPRGMLDPWALRNSRLKKKILSLLYANANLRAAACIHALCESEYESIRGYGLKNPVAIIPNGIDLPEVNRVLPVPWQGQIPKEKKVMLFLGRLHPKKGLSNLIKAWAKLKIENRVAIDEWVLAIAGWSQVGHEEELKKLVQQLNCQSDVLFLGPLYGDRKQAALRAANAFVLPSQSEGLPMSVLEAWAYSLPVIMTRECNITEGFEANAAIKIRPEVDSIVNGLSSFFRLSDTDRQMLGQNGRALIESRFSWDRITAEMINVYKWVLGQNPKPECVRLE